MNDDYQDELWSETSIRLLVGFAVVISVIVGAILVLAVVAGLVENPAITLGIIALIPGAALIIYLVGDRVVRHIDKVDGR